MIEKTALVSNTYVGTFYKEVRERIDEFQNERLIVEIQYVPYTDGVGKVFYTALIIGRSNVNA